MKEKLNARPLRRDILAVYKDDNGGYGRLGHLANDILKKIEKRLCSPTDVALHEISTIMI